VRLLAGMLVPAHTDRASGSLTGVRNLLKNRAYIGEARHGEHAKPNSHQAIVPRQLFERAQHVRGVAIGRTADGEGRLLSGLIRCASCRHTMSGAASTGRYKCSNDNCKARAVIMSEPVEQSVLGMYSMFVEAPAHVASESAATLQAELTDAEAELSAYIRMIKSIEPGFREGYDHRRRIIDDAAPTWRGDKCGRDDRSTKHSRDPRCSSLAAR
jgi:hypothetical protein